MFLSLTSRRPFSFRPRVSYYPIVSKTSSSFRYRPRRCTYQHRQLKQWKLFSLSQDLPKSIVWWQKDTDVWCDVDGVEKLEGALRCPDYEICVVDWFATWCHGCRKTSPILTGMARDEVLNSRVKFIRACVDGMADYARKQGVKALPYLSIYDNEGRKLLSFGAAASRADTFRRNIETVLENKGKDFRLDPNGYALAMDRVDAEAKQKETEEAVRALREYKAKLARKLDHDVPKPASPQLQPTERDTIEEKQAFLDRYGTTYGYGGLLNSMYDFELGRRLGKGQHYLDYTGSSVYTETQLTAVMKDFRENVFGNPHSENPSSSLTRDRIEEVRRMVLDFFDADPRDYQVIFTKSATAALKMIGETYPWTEHSSFRYLRENHNSVLGIREYVLKNGGRFEDLTEEEVDAWIDQSPFQSVADQPTYHLFAYPAEDNFAGVKYPLTWIQGIRNKTTRGEVWKVLLDAAAYVGTQPLSLKQFPADYVAVSFYKMFGYPTGLGALILRVDDIDILRKVFWAGGSVALATSHNNFHVLKCRPTERLEDGTVAFLDIISLKRGFEALSRCGGVKRIQQHVWSLTEWLYDRLSDLKHSNGKPMVKIFGKHGRPDSPSVQGGILNFELLGAKGKVMSYKQFEKEAAEAGFHVRTGIECNPGAAYNYIGIEESEVESLAGLTEGCEDELEYIQVSRPRDEIMFDSVDTAELNHLTMNEKLVQIPLGSVRISLGYLSTFEDCLAFVRFLECKWKDKEQQ